MNLEKKLKHYRLTTKEWESAKKYLGRDLTDIEWALFSALWSEHCSYKSSKVHLRKFYTKNARVVQGPGENAGVIDLGEGERVAFKMESHNHPSFIEPHQGAATGVGGILRDIFTMGARPMALMNYLCFGDSKNENTSRLLNGVVSGIGSYGNCVGVPTINGQTTFHKTYNKNNLVNAYALGLFRPGEKVFYGKASGVGNRILYVGALTGRDGVHGAAMASESFDNDLEKKKPNIQIGDPFYEKLLIEACLEIMKQDLVVGIQDMGAAGLTSSSFEMASRANSGLRMDLKKVPLREPDITPEEILLSESQERMLLVVLPSKVEAVREICTRWDLQVSDIGEIIKGDEVELYWGTEILSKVKVAPLVEHAPVYERPLTKSPRQKLKRKFGSLELTENNLMPYFIDYLKDPNNCSRQAIHHSYDQRVGGKTLACSPEPIGVVRLPDSGRALGMALGCRPELMAVDTRAGSLDAIALPVLQLAAKGIKALAVTDCLNFGNPEKPEIMAEFAESVETLSEACRAFDTPVISGNVSLYNETLGESIVGTPSTAIVGVGPQIDLDQKYLPSSVFQKIGETIYLIESSNTSVIWGENPPEVDLEGALHLQGALLGVSELCTSTRVVGRGGFLKTLAMMAIDQVGAQIDYFENQRTFSEFLFGDRFYAVVMSVDPNKQAEFLERSRLLGVFPKKIGVTGEKELRINHYFRMDVSSIQKLYSVNLKESVGV